MTPRVELPLKVIGVCGSRYDEDWVAAYVAEGLSRAPSRLRDFTTIVVGSESGVDGAAVNYARKNELDFIVVPAWWKTGGHGGAEGPIRNKRMHTRYGPLSGVLAFPGGRGTASMINISRKSRCPVWTFEDGKRWARVSGAFGGGSRDGCD